MERKLRLRGWDRCAVVRPRAVEIIHLRRRAVCPAAGWGGGPCAPLLAEAPGPGCPTSRRARSILSEHYRRAQIAIASRVGMPLGFTGSSSDLTSEGSMRSTALLAAACLGMVGAHSSVAASSTSSQSVAFIVATSGRVDVARPSSKSAERGTIGLGLLRGDKVQVAADGAATDRK